ncbi:hypothetical protein AAKU55_002568 [Oxalobacteraceae bacterium GrIS 1.11]
MPPPVAPVPPHYQGLWRRTGIWRRDGSADLSTRVWWCQSPRFHIDLRIPAQRPPVSGAAALARLAPRQLALFAAQTGFAGLTLVDRARCEWRPEIAFPAVSAEIDAGLMRFDTADNLHESGIDGGYEEDWLRLAGGPMRGLRLESGDGALAYLLLGEAWAAWAYGRPDNSFPATPAGSEFSILRRQAGDAWQIVASNCPWLEGAQLFLNGAQLSLCAPGDSVTLATPVSRQWRVSALA